MNDDHTMFLIVAKMLVNSSEYILPPDNNSHLLAAKPLYLHTFKMPVIEIYRQ
jgi:hypothetical protein